jgi:putative membrane protein
MRARMKIKPFLFTILLVLPAFAMADTKTTDKTTDKTADKAKPTDKATLAEDDVKVMAHVKHVNDMEIDMGKMAKTNGTASVKSYGNTLVKDHTANNTKLTALAKKKGITTIPQDQPMTEDQKRDHQMMMDGMTRLQNLKGAEFDREFITMMIESHDKTIGRLDAGIASVKDADLVSHLKATKPVVQRHADAARELQKKTVSQK